MKITFLGATDSVTGSRFLVEHERARVLVDCGLFQGAREIRERNWERFPVSPRKIDAILLTHAHIDHSGFIPALVKQGFRGKVFCTSATKSLCEILLPDSARLQEEEADYRNRHGATRFHPALPAYTIKDAERALELFDTQRMQKTFEPAPGLSASFSYAGHILGAACVQLSDGQTGICFSGDVGRPDDLLMRPPAPLPACDYLVLESTYGDRRHEKTDPTAELESIIVDTVKRNGVIIIPSFAVGRAQLILYILSELTASGRIPELPIFLDSPMAINATELFCLYTHEHRLDPEDCRRMSAHFQYTPSVNESKGIRSVPGSKIIVSASGMATGGRVLHHLRNYLPDRRNTVILAGYQAEGTRGAQLEDGAEQIHILGEYVPVRARVASLRSLSAHADYQQLTDWISALEQPPRTTFLVHGEMESRQCFKQHLDKSLGWNIHLPGFGETVEL